MNSSFLCPRCGLKSEKPIPAPFTQPYRFLCERCFQDLVVEVSNIYEGFFWHGISETLKRSKPVQEHYLKRFLRKIKEEDFYRPWIVKFLERCARNFDLAKVVKEWTRKGV